MRRRSYKSDFDTIITGIVLVCIMVPIAIVYILITTIMDFIPTILPIILIIAIIIMSCYLLIILYEFIFYNSSTFKNIFNKVSLLVNNCNELNAYIESLKHSYVNYRKYNYGYSNYYDDSNYNFKRKKLKNIKFDDYIFDCSLTIAKNSKNQPYKYLCKYFNIDISESTLTDFEKILGNFLSVEQGKKLLVDERDRIIKLISKDVPWIFRTFRRSVLYEKLGILDININEYYFPKFIFRYISAGGNSSMINEITLDITNLQGFIEFLNLSIHRKNSISYQRALMTSQLREKIKIRDNYTCKQCGLSIFDEPNLLLEIDHIIPLSKDGKTTVENLQTLCWKCNRKKGSKIIDSSTENDN